jgi:hypothetical protein
MSLDEARTMNDAIRQHFSDAFDEEIPAYKPGQFKKIFDAYDNLSPATAGMTKKDGRKGQRIMNSIRDFLTHWNPTEENYATFRPLFDAELNRFEEGSKLQRFQDKWLNGKMFEMTRKMNK